MQAVGVCVNTYLIAVDDNGMLVELPTLCGVRCPKFLYHFQRLVSSRGKICLGC
jgi:hypothetical protein